MTTMARSSGRTAVVLMALMVVASTVQAQPLPALRTAVSSPHVLRDAVARQHAPLRPGGPRRASAVATKVTAGVAMGVAGFFAGATVAVLLQAATSGGRDVGGPGVLAGAAAGAAAGGAFGVWLASR